MTKFKVLEQKYVYESERFCVRREQLQRPDASVLERDMVTHPGAVVVIARESDQTFIVLRQYRHPIRETILEFPAGTLDRAEEPLACAKRELTEETNLSAANWQALGTLYPAPGFCDERQHLFLAQDLTPQAGQLDEDEVIEVLHMSEQEIVRAISSGEMNDAKSISIFCRAKFLGMI